MFTADTYAQRRARLSASLPSGLLLFLGNDESPMNYTDNTYHFRQDSTWLYYFGLAQPGLAAVIDLDAGRTVIFGDDLGLGFSSFSRVCVQTMTSLEELKASYESAA